MTENNHSSEEAAATPVQTVQNVAKEVSAEAAKAMSDTRRAMRDSATMAKEKASDSLLSAADTIRNEALKHENEELQRQAQTLARGMIRIRGELQLLDSLLAFTRSRNDLEEVAVALCEQNRCGEGSFFRRKATDCLLDTIFDNLEVAAFQPRDKLAVFIQHGHVQNHQVRRHAHHIVILILHRRVAERHRLGANTPGRNLREEDSQGHQRDEGKSCAESDRVRHNFSKEIAARLATITGSTSRAESDQATCLPDRLRKPR